MPDEPIDAIEQLEKALAGIKDGHYVLRLYVTGMTPRSAQAIATLREICESHLKGRYQLDVIDIYQQPDKAREGQVLAAPTLIKLLPPPLRRLVGDFSRRERVLIGLDLQVVEEPLRVEKPAPDG